MSLFGKSRGIAIQDRQPMVNIASPENRREGLSSVGEREKMGRAVSVA